MGRPESKGQQAFRVAQVLTEPPGLDLLAYKETLAYKEPQADWEILAFRAILASDRLVCRACKELLG
jgi:hypothetical protein